MKRRKLHSIPHRLEINRSNVMHSIVLDVRSFRGADCDTDCYLVIAKVRERLAVGKQAAQMFDRQRFNLRKLNEPEVREQYQMRLQTGLQLWRT